MVNDHNLLKKCNGIHRCFSVLLKLRNITKMYLRKHLRKCLNTELRLFASPQPNHRRNYIKILCRSDFCKNTEISQGNFDKES